MIRAGASLANVLLCGAGVAACVTASSPPPPSVSPNDAPRSAARADDDDDFRSRPPAPEPATDYVAPAPKQSVLPNGMRLWVIDRQTSKAIAVTLVLRGGAAAFPREPAILFSMLGTSLMGGTTTHTGRELFDLMSVHFFLMDVVSWDSSFRLTMNATPDSFDGALEMLRDVALRPTLPPDRVESMRQRYLGGSPRAADDPLRIANRNLFGAFYGQTHPYTRTMDPIAPALATIKRDDVLRAWKEMMDPAQATLIIAGAVNTATVAARVQALFGDWKRDPAAEAQSTVPLPSPTSARLIVVDRPGAPQATVLYGTTAAPIQASAHLNDVVVRQLLGGMRSSVTTGKIRDELGAAWTSTTYQHVDRAGGITWWQGNVARDRTAAVLTALDARVRELHERGPEADELAAATSRLARAQPRSLETTSGLAAAFADAATNDLPLDDLATLPARLRKVSAGDVKAQVPEPTAAKAVVVGDLGVLRASLLRLGWGPIEEHDKDGHFVRMLSP
ncbi:MAG: zinc protease [Myxococcales bacterium]|jgi:zinc protease|nr:zinc protease [Myxococcales bacterium]